MLTDEQIKKLQEIWEKRFGRKISAEEADAQGGRLVRIVRLICEPTASVPGKPNDGDKINQKNN